MVFCVSPSTNSSSSSPDYGLDLTEYNLSKYDSCQVCDIVPQDDESTGEASPPSSQALVASALQSLSLEEREKVFDDIHGVDTRAEEAEALETPEFLEKQLEFFHDELNLYKLLNQGDPDLQAFEIAEQRDLSFVQDPNMRMAFLRTRDWDVAAAVAAFVKYFDLKQYLFGQERLTEHLSLNDLSEYEMNQESKGYFQVLPNRDRAGRAVVVWFNVGQEYDSVESMARLVFVMLPVDVESQRRGLSFVSMRISAVTYKSGQSTVAAIPVMNRLIYQFPIRVSVFHMCLSNSLATALSLKSLVDAIVPSHASSKMKARMRFHGGSYVEWCYKLQTFGVPVHLLPSTPDFKIKPKNHRDLLEMMHHAASKGQYLDAILLPTNRDLLLGKGKPIQQSPGNVKWSELLEVMIMANPDTTSPMMYVELAGQVVQCVHKFGGRILSKDSGVWEVVPDDVAQERVVNMMRNRRFRRRHRG